MLRRGTPPNGTMAWVPAILSTSLVGAAAPLPENVGKPDLAPLLPRRSPASWVGARKTVGAPVLAADAVVHREKTIGVVARLDRPKALEVRARECRSTSC